MAYNAGAENARIIMRVNGLRFDVPLNHSHDKAVGRIISGKIFEETAEDRILSVDEALDNAVDAVLGRGASAEISVGRRLDTFDRLTLAAYICGEYLRRSADIRVWESDKA